MIFKLLSLDQQLSLGTCYENLLEIQVLEPRTRTTESEALGVRFVV